MGRYFETINILFLIQLSPTCFIIYWWFSYVIIPYIRWLCIVRAFAYLFVSVWTHGFLFYWMCYILLLFILMPKLSHIWAMGTPSSWLLCAFDMFPSFFEHFFTWIARWSRFFLYFSCPSAGIHYFSKEPSSLLL